MFKVELQSAVRFVLGTSGRRAWLVAAGLSWVWDSGWVGYGGMGAKTVGGYRLALESHDRYTVLTRGSSGREPRSGQSDHDAPIDGGKMKKWTGKVENGMLVTWRRVGGPHGRPTYICRAPLGAVSLTVTSRRTRPLVTSVTSVTTVTPVEGGGV